MRHGYYLRPDFFGNTVLFAVIIFFLMLITVLLILRILKNKRKNKELGLTEAQKNTIDNFSSLVCSMLSQRGQGLKQNEISSNLGLPMTITADKLSEMEKSGEITRKWENEDYTFIISKK